VKFASNMFSFCRASFFVNFKLKSKLKLKLKFKNNGRPQKKMMEDHEENDKLRVY
jgi:hypothetical protein